MEQVPQSIETGLSQEKLSLASEVLGEYIKGVEPGSARAWAIADYKDLQQANLDVSRFLAASLDENLSRKLVVENDSDLRIAEQTLSGINLRISEHSATLKGYADAATFIDEVTSAVVDEIDSEAEALEWLGNQTHTVFDDDDDNLSELTERLNGN